jgi:hypothetical protein
MRFYTAPMRLHPALFALSIACLLACAGAAAGTRSSGWTFDPQELMARSEAVIVRTPDASLDHLFQAVAEAARQPRELQAMCAVFDPRARRDLGALNRIALGFGTGSQRNFQRATDVLLQASRDAPPQPYDAQLAQRALRQATVASAMLYDGFVAAINSPDSDTASQQARCRALRQLLDTVSMRPLNERAMITRLLMREGLRRIER